MASDKDFYPEGTDMLYFDAYDKEVTMECPECKESGIQTVTIASDHHTIKGECDYCNCEWEEQWWEEPDYDMSDLDYYDNF